MEKIFSPHLKKAQEYWKAHLTESDWAIDATCGNGNDTLFLSELCSVIGFDIQEKAIENTRELLSANGKQATLYHLSHDLIDTIPFPAAPKLIVYNLGYLPRGDKSITTMVDTTVRSVEKSLQLLATDGAISIMCYPGHEEGMREEKALLHFLQSLPSHLFTICYHQWINRLRSPSFIWLEKIVSIVDYEQRKL